MSQELHHISEKPWSTYTTSDYTIEQWDNACLIHQHDGAPTSKNQCKLPVKTPNGALNRNGVHAAAAALAGARGGVNASAEEKDKAAKALIRFYGQLNETPPPSLLKHSNVIEFIEHHGVKGMHWGIRNKTNRISEIGKKRKSTKRAQTKFTKPAHRLSDEELNKRIRRIELEKKYNTLRKQDLTPGKKVANELLGKAGKKVASTLLAAAGTLVVAAAIAKAFGPETAKEFTGKDISKIRKHFKRPSKSFNFPDPKTFT